MTSTCVLPIRNPSRLAVAAAIALTLGGTAAASADAAGRAPAASSITFVRSGDLMAISPAGGTPRLLAQASTDPDVSPDGRHVAYTHARDVWVMRRDGKGKRRLTTDGRFNEDPSWSPDGKRIVFSKNPVVRPDLYVVKASGGKARQLTATADHEERNAAWSPDGRRIAYERSGCEKPRDGGACVYVMGADGRGQTNLTPERQVPGCELAPGYAFHGQSRQPAWSADGSRIVFSGPLTCRIGTTGTDLWIMDPSGGSKLALHRDHGTEDATPSYSPDGTRIVLARPGEGLFVMPATGGAPFQLTRGVDGMPNW